MKPSAPTSANRYAVPALDKGLDLLELLAAQPAGLSLTELASAASRKVSEIFRVVDCLKRRGFVGMDAQTDRLVLTMRLFELAHRFPPTERLVAAALPRMQSLATRVGQSCHLAVHSAGEMLVIAQVDSALQMGFAVHVGARVGLTTSSSGRVFLAFQPPADRQRLLAMRAPPPPSVQPAATSQRNTGKSTQALTARLKRIAAAGHEAVPSDLIHGVTNISHPVFDVSGRCIASLTVPYLHWDVAGACALPDTVEQMQGAAAAISAAIGHTDQAPSATHLPRRARKPRG